MPASICHGSPVHTASLAYHIPIHIPINIPMHGPINIPINTPMHGPINIPISIPIDIPINIPMHGPIDVPISTRAGASLITHHGSPDSHRCRGHRTPRHHASASPGTTNIRRARVPQLPAPSPAAPSGRLRTATLTTLVVTVSSRAPPPGYAGPSLACVIHTHSTHHALPHRNRALSAAAAQP